MLVVGQARPAFLMTVRGEGLREHPGETAFPGGRVDPGDASPLETGLRELNEEVGIKSHDIHFIGYLHVIPIFSSGYGVIPVVARFEGDWERSIQVPNFEVSRVFLLPLEIALDRTRYVFKTVPGSRSMVPILDWEDGPPVWGATARILMSAIEGAPDVDGRDETPPVTLNP
jgi:8-oxo-dGTP pyrophosphatase MutT (NUDIX family)